MIKTKQKEEQLKKNQLFGRTLRYFRKKAGISTEEVAVKVGVTNQTVVAWEMGHTGIAIGKVDTILSLLDISYIDFFKKAKELGREI